MSIPSKPVLLTGASGNLGRMLARELGAKGWTLRLTDLTPFPDPLPEGATLTRMDLADGVALLKLAEGCGAILHFGGASTDLPFETVIGPNLRGVYHVYEAARRALLNPQCNPLPLPKDRLEALRNTVFRFNPRDLGLR